MREINLEVTMADGEVFRIIREDGKYYYRADGVHIRKGNRNIVSVVKVRAKNAEKTAEENSDKGA